MITRKNYEIYFMDYLEGNLSDNEISMVEIFLKENPDLEEELTQFSDFKIIENKETLKIDFSHLKKKSIIDSVNEDAFFIGKIEGDLKKNELKALALYLNEFPEKVKVLESFEKAILKQETLLFPNKKALKQSRKIGPYYYLVAGIAACMLAMFYINVSIGFDKLKPLVAANVNSYEVELLKNQLSLENPISVEVPTKKRTLKVKSRVKIPVALKPEQDPKQEIEITKEKDNSINKKVKVEQKKEIEVKEVFIPIKNKEVLIPIQVEKELTVKEYAKEKILSFIEEKTTGKKDESENLLAFVSKKVSKIPLPKFIDYKSERVKEQKVITVKIGNKFSITRKIKI